MIIRLQSLALVAVLLLGNLPNALTASPNDLPADTPISKILALAASSLSAGSSQDALAYYDLAVSRYPGDYLTLFKRGATYLSLGRSPQALSDFDKVLAIKPGFEGALLQRAKIRARSANWSGAREDYVAAGRKDGIEIQELAEAEEAVQLARDAEKKNDWEGCVTHAGTAIMTAGASLELRHLRAKCRFERGEVVEGVADLQHALQINPGATEPNLRISAMTFYSLGETEKGLEAIRKCLHSDPDSKSCVKLLKREKKIDKALKKVNNLLSKRQFASAVKLLVQTEEDAGLIAAVKEDIAEFRQSDAIHPKAGEGLVVSVLEMTCNAYIEMNNHKRGAPYCTELLQLSATSLPALLHAAQAQLDADDFQGAINTLTTAKDAHPGASATIQPKLQEAHTLLKRSKSKDYYKTLGVARDASAKEIKRAYLTLSKTHHPDKIADPALRPAAETKMALINEAYEVLGDPELRARFDRGDDPNSPEGQNGGQPFHGSPFGAGGQQFFHFQHGGGGGGNPFGGFKFQGGGGFAFP